VREGGARMRLRDARLRECAVCLLRANAMRMPRMRALPRMKECTHYCCRRHFRWHATH